METKKNEVRYYTSDPAKMLNMYTTSQVTRSWKDPFVGENGELQEVERHELILDRGVCITNDVLSELKFWMEEGSVKEIEVSNQKRMSYEVENTCMYPFRAVVSIEGKKSTFLFYALSVRNAIDVLNDYIELNFCGRFAIVDIKQLDYCVILVDKLKTIRQRNLELDIAYLNDEISIEEYMDCKIEDDDKSGSEEDENDTLKLKFYQIGAKIIQRIDETDREQDEYNQTFIVRTFSATRANMIIAKWLQDQQERRYQESLLHPDAKFVKRQIMSFIEESKILSVGDFIPRQFSQAYCQEDWI